MELWKTSLIVLIAIMAILYLVLIPLSKKHALKKQNTVLNEMNSSLKIGSQVILVDGIVGTITALNQDEAKIEIAKKTIVTVKRIAIAGCEGVKKDGSLEKVSSKPSQSIKA